MRSLLHRHAPPLFLFCLAILACYPTASEAACGISPPGQPKVNGYPKCPCGQLYVASINCVGAIPSVCSTCDPKWTAVGCYATTSSSYHTSATNVRCSCSSGGCCVTSGATSGTYRPSGYVCSSAGGVCQNSATCSGSSASCPAKTYKSASTVCSAASGTCQNAAKCTGSAAACPAKTFKSSSTKCFSKTGPCQNDMYCTGSAVACPTTTYAAAGSVCSAASGPCENPSTCSGSTAPCPAKTLKSSSSVCHPSRGPCENAVHCNGTSVACPPYSFLPNTTICAESNQNCFLDANCPGNGPNCRVNLAQPLGTSCGNNSLCSTFTNNTCDAFGDCLTSECLACPNGLQGADCTCPGGPPTSDIGPLNATCFNGTWTVIADINGSLTIQPGTTVVITGIVTIPAGHTIEVGAGSYTNFTECVNITGTLIGTYSPKSPLPAGLQFVENCSTIMPQVQPNAVSSEASKCISATTTTSTGAGLLSILFTLSNTCKKNSNLLVYIVAPVLSVAALAAIALATALIVKHYHKKKQTAPNIM